MDGLNAEAAMRRLPFRQDRLERVLFDLCRGERSLEGACRTLAQRARAIPDLSTIASEHDVSASLLELLVVNAPGRWIGNLRERAAALVVGLFGTRMAVGYLLGREHRQLHRYQCALPLVDAAHRRLIERRLLPAALRRLAALDRVAADLGEPPGR